MKNIFSIAITFFVSTSIYAQSNIQKGFENIKTQLTKEIKPLVKPTINYPNNKAPGDTLWSEDFTNGLPQGWYSHDNTGNNYDWVINSGNISNTTLTPSGYTDATSIASNSGGNYMLLFSGEYNRLATPLGNEIDMDSYFQTNGIQLNNAPSLSVSFQQQFRICCGITPAPEAVLVASTDSTFATNVEEFDMIQDFGFPLAPLTHNVSINISSIAANYTGKIWLRFYAKSGFSHYYWMVDDISIVETPPNDIITTSAAYGFTPTGKHGLQYTRIPIAHIQPIDFAMVAENVGYEHQSGTNLTVKINDGNSTIFNQSTQDIILDSLTKDTLEMLSAWIPPTTIGVPYTIIMDVFSDSIDFTPNNNSHAFPPFEISQYTYALDDYNPNPINGETQPDPNGSTEHEVGNFFEAVVDDIATGIEFLAGSNTGIGTSVDAVLYKYSGSGNYTEIARSANHVISSSDITIPKTLHLVNSSTGTSPNIQKDSIYFAAIHSSNNDFRFASSGSSATYGILSQHHSLVAFPDLSSFTTIYELTTTPMIRLITDPVYLTINESDKKIDFRIFPNPSNGVFNLNLSSNDNKNVNLSVKNIVGQTVLTETVNVSGNTNHQISLTDYSKGIYLLTIDSETVKLIVE